MHDALAGPFKLSCFGGMTVMPVSGRHGRTEETNKQYNGVGQLPLRLGPFHLCLKSLAMGLKFDSEHETRSTSRSLRTDIKSTSGHGHGHAHWHTACASDSDGRLGLSVAPGAGRLD